MQVWLPLVAEAKKAAAQSFPMMLREWCWLKNSLRINQSHLMLSARH